MHTIHNYIDGKPISISKKFLDVEDPSTGEIIAKVVLSNQEDFYKLIESSKKSQISWSNTTPLKRSRILSKYKNLILVLLIKKAKFLILQLVNKNQK